LIVGEYGEYSKDIDFEIHIDNDFASFTAEHLTDQRKKDRIQGAIEGLETSIKKGEQLLEQYRFLSGDSFKSQGFYSEIYKWRWDTEGLIQKRLGRIHSDRFASINSLIEFPDEFTTENSEGLTEFYTRLLTLKDITRVLKEANPLP
ncbi:MAG: hypothetical protein ACR2F2_07550, partial [Pyrinomonadaceae bacterium]